MTLHVHHKFYERNREPWEYDDEDYKVLCEECHWQTELAINRLRKVFGGVEFWDINNFVDIMEMAISIEPPSCVVNFLKFALSVESDLVQNQGTEVQSTEAEGLGLSENVRDIGGIPHVC